MFCFVLFFFLGSEGVCPSVPAKQKSEGAQGEHNVNLIARCSCHPKKIKKALHATFFFLQHCRVLNKMCQLKKKKNVKIALFSPPSFHDLACPGLTDMHVWWHDDSHTVRKSVQRPFRPPSLYAQSQKLTENEYFWFMPDGSFRAHLLVVSTGRITERTTR